MKRLFAIIAILMAFTFAVSDAVAADIVADGQAVAAQENAAGVPGEESFMEKATRFCLDNLNYGTVTLFMAIESSFIPFPSEAVVPPAAWKAAVTGEMSLFLVVLFATLGALIGALFNYYLALWLGRPVVYKFANSRIGHMCLLDEEKVQKAEAYFDKHGAVSTFFGRLVPAVRQLISIPAGIARMGLARFVFFTTLGAGVWNTILAVLGYYMASIPGLQTEEAVMNKVKEYSGAIGLVFIALAVLIVGILVYKAFSKGKKAE
jgi:membrane protein DedA with SNARE-associated domain